MAHHDLLIEIFTEELPPKRLSLLEHAFANHIRQQLVEAELSFSSVRSFATPRRLAIIVSMLVDQQPAQKIERKGPNVKQAYDAQGQLTPAGKGFLSSCGITIDQLSTIQTDKGECLNFVGEKPGLSVDTLIPEIIKKALKELPIPKPMRWGNHDFSFIRPVHSVILLYGERVIEAEFFGITTHRCTYGHRQLSHGSIDISFPENYPAELEDQGYVIADSAERKAIILDQIQTNLQALSEATNRSALKIAITDQQEYEDLLEEITALVEWPKVLLCRFDEKFLNIPKEALMASMQSHQKCFAIADADEKLLPYFITVSNLNSEDEEAVIRGNERVMRARLSDAKFFYETDLKTSLESYAPRLASTIYQEKLGTLKDKVERVTKLAIYFSEQIGADVESTKRAAKLCKLDLFSHMVGEFPELQGIMGKYYALHDGEKPEVAHAIEEHYWPRFSDDKIPTVPVSVALALADRLDTIVSFFSVGLIPTGDKDPFALKRAALGVLKIIINNQLPIMLPSFIVDTVTQPTMMDHTTELFLDGKIISFFKERFKTIILEKNIPLDVFNATPDLTQDTLCEILKRMQALQLFKNHPNAESIIQTDKRIKNIISKNNNDDSGWIFSSHKCEKEIEEILMQKISEIRIAVNSLIKKSDYSGALLALSEIKPFVDRFFEEVMVIVLNLELRHNRLTIVKQLRELFLSVGDLSELQL